MEGRIDDQAFCRLHGVPDASVPSEAGEGAGGRRLTPRLRLKLRTNLLEPLVIGIRRVCSGRASSILLCPATVAVQQGSGSFIAGWLP
jgi:hypothetical protein